MPNGLTKSLGDYAHNGAPYQMFVCLLSRSRGLTLQPLSNLCPVITNVHVIYVKLDGHEHDSVVGWLPQQITIVTELHCIYTAP